VPIIEDVLSARLAYQHWNRDGYGKSSKTGERLGGDHDDDVARLSVRFDPTANFTSSTKIEYVNLDQNGFLTTLRAVPPGSLANLEAAFEGGSLVPYTNTGDIFTNSQEAKSFTRVKTWHAVEDMTWDISDDVKLRSVTGSRRRI
jgi:hypothetical protein